MFALSFDTDVHRWFLEQRTGILDDGFRTVTHLGAAAVLLPVVLVTIGVALWRRRPDLAVGVAVATIGTWCTVNVILKPLIGRARPPLADRLVFPGDASFPSGHAANAAATWFAVAWVTASLVSSKATKVTVWSVAGVVVALVGVSRLYLGVHWPTDVLAGWALGALWVAAGVAVAARVRRQRNGAM